MRKNLSKQNQFNIFLKPEYLFLNKALKKFSHSKQQINKIHEADCEIIKISKDQFLAISTDSMAEEIDIELYKDPYTWGWISVMNSVSDLLVTGSTPIGVVISTQWSKKITQKQKLKFYSGVNQALKKMKIHLLGGDNGHAHSTSITVTILGTSQIKPLTRIGAKPNDLIILLGKNIGYGPLCAFDYLFFNHKNRIEKLFRPTPQKIPSEIIPYINASIDSSDGIITSLEIVSQLNKVNYSIFPEKIVPEKIISYYLKKFKIPKDYILLSDLGDLQSILFVSPPNYNLIKNKLPAHFIIGSVMPAESKSDFDISLVKKLSQRNANYKKIISTWISQKNTPVNVRK